ncbi:MAG: PD-(D/E)XK nuclease family transposase, partial [Bacteroidales bacterium]|nr:PD-(D/E)XK nuclease family transposase [Bacteroidales bacterium]
MINEKYIRFDWAAKRMLRDKANFDVLEGLMTVLIGEQVKIEEILESEGNQNAADDKYNRVDVMARNSKGEFIIVEVQLSREVHFIERMLYGVSKVVTDNIRLGNKYDKVKKVYSINIIYFPLGHGSDYVYHGTTRFVGI